jgi:hypothetical protein
MFLLQTNVFSTPQSESTMFSKLHLDSSSNDIDIDREDLLSKFELTNCD